MKRPIAWRAAVVVFVANVVAGCGAGASSSAGALGTTTTYPLTLTEPLGSRVLLGSDGGPIPVTGA